jgi:protein-S-isoprenylcysteine O-methyltransferase Ste14
LWRTRIEERLLRQSFGAAYDRYVEQVPALLPGWRLK